MLCLSGAREVLAKAVEVQPSSLALWESAVQLETMRGGQGDRADRALPLFERALAAPTGN